MQRRVLLAIGLFLFQLLFWREGIGINWIVFSFLALVAIRKPQPPSLQEWLYATPYVLASLGVLLFHTTFSIIGLALTFTTYLGFIANQQHSVVENFLNSLISFPLQKRLATTEKGRRVPSRRWQRSLAISALPLGIFALFYVLFLAGNPVFKSFSNKGFNKVAHIFEGLDFTWIFFILLGFLITNWILRNGREKHLEMDSSAGLVRSKRKRVGFFKTMALKNEYRSAVLLFAMLNALFLVVNIIDVKWVWFQFQVEENFNLKEFVHEGVGWLIFTTLLSSAILLIYFRKNLNFFPNNKRLVLLARIWVVQNIILAISVAIRAFHYINFHGLAPRRIGVLIFVVFILSSFIAVGIKIHKTYRTEWVVKWVSGVSIVLIGICSIIPWNHWIAQHNLSHDIRNEVDVDYYLNLGPELYPTIYAHLDVIEAQIEAHQSNDVRWINYTNIGDFKTVLDRRRWDFVADYERYGMASWSYSRQKAYLALKGTSSLAMVE